MNKKEQRQLAKINKELNSRYLCAINEACIWEMHHKISVEDALKRIYFLSACTQGKYKVEKVKK